MRYPTIDRIHAVQRVMIPSPGQVMIRSRKDSVGASITWIWRVSPHGSRVGKYGFTSTKMCPVITFIIFMAEVHVEIKIQDLFGTRVNSCKI